MRWLQDNMGLLVFQRWRNLQKAKLNTGLLRGDFGAIGKGTLIYPPYSVAVGVPAKVVKRYNPESGKRERV